MSEKNRYVQVMEILYGFDWQTQLTPYYIESCAITPESSRHAQLQKARREIAEGKGTSCSVCGLPQSKHTNKLLILDGRDCPNDNPFLRY